ncbi:MAG: RNA polymerase sigma factor [Bacteroidota bacterium]
MNPAEKDELKILIRGCNEGSRRSQQRVYERFYGKMLGVCMRYAKDRDEAKDILQEGFIKVFGNIRKYTGDGSFEGWVRRIMVNTAIDAFRKNKTSAMLPDSDYIDRIKDDSGEADEQESIFDTLDTKRIMQEVQNLSPAYRMVFSLYVVEGYSHQEIADQLGISVGTSKSNLSKAKMNLKKAFKTLISHYNG